MAEPWEGEGLRGLGSYPLTRTPGGALDLSLRER